jgi:hypothetical protein
MLPFILGVVIGAAFTSSKRYDREINKILKTRKTRLQNLRQQQQITLEGMEYDSRAKEYYVSIITVDRNSFTLSTIPIMLNEVKYYSVVIKNQVRPFLIDKLERLKLQDFMG